MANGDGALRMLDALRTINRGVAIVVGIGLLLCAAFVLLDIVMRQLGSSLGGTDEISGYVMAIATAWGMAYTLLELGHVRIDLIRGRMMARGRALFDLFAMLVLTGTVTTIAYRAWPVVERSLKNSSRANTPLETPLSWVQVPWFAGWTWFAIVAWLTLLAALVLVARGDYAQSEQTIGAFAEEETL